MTVQKRKIVLQYQYCPNNFKIKIPPGFTRTNSKIYCESYGHKFNNNCDWRREV